MIKVVIYKNHQGWGWAMSASNGALIAESMKLYTRRDTCIHNLELVTMSNLRAGDGIYFYLDGADRYNLVDIVDARYAK